MLALLPSSSSAICGAPLAAMSWLPAAGSSSSSPSELMTLMGWPSLPSLQAEQRPGVRGEP
jgi:hypothetical protein